MLFRDISSSASDLSLPLRRSCSRPPDSHEPRCKSDVPLDRRELLDGNEPRDSCLVGGEDQIKRLLLGSSAREEGDLVLSLRRLIGEGLDKILSLPGKLRLRGLDGPTANVDEEAASSAG